MATTEYCTIDQVKNRLSADGVTYRADDTPPTLYGDVIDEASREVDLWLLDAYSEGDLAASTWVQHQTANMAAYFLCERRGNPVPVGIEQKFERTLERLDKVRREVLNVPDVMRRRTSAPRLSQPRVRLDPFPRTVIERKRGSREARAPRDYQQHSDALEWFDYGAGI